MGRLVPLHAVDTCLHASTLRRTPARGVGGAGSDAGAPAERTGRTERTAAGPSALCRRRTGRHPFLPSAFDPGARGQGRPGAARRTLITAPARRPGMARYDVQAVIGNKPGLSDPEGSTILEDLVLKGGTYSGVSAVRTAKMIRFTVSAPSARAAAATVRRLCDELRIYNPLVSELSVTASAAGGGRGRRRASN